MAKKIKPTIGQIEFNNKLRNIYNATEIKVKLGDLEQILRAARKTITFYLEHDHYTGIGLAVDSEEMAKAYKKVNDSIQDTRRITKHKATQVLLKDYEVEEL